MPYIPYYILGYIKIIFLFPFSFRLSSVSLSTYSPFFGQVYQFLPTIFVHMLALFFAYSFIYSFWLNVFTFFTSPIYIMYTIYTLLPQFLCILYIDFGHNVCYIIIRRGP